MASMPLVIQVETTIAGRDRCGGCGGLARVKDRDPVVLTDLPAGVSPDEEPGRLHAIDVVELDEETGEPVGGPTFVVRVV